MAAYFVPGNDHLVHLVGSPSIPAPFLMFIRHVVFALASYSLMKKTTVRQRECSTGRPRIPQLFLCLRTAPLSDAVTRVTIQHLFSPQIFIGKTEIPPITSYDDVIKNRNSKQLTCFDQPSSDSTIFLRGLAVGRRMIVPTDD